LWGLLRIFSHLVSTNEESLGPLIRIQNPNLRQIQVWWWARMLIIVYNCYTCVRYVDLECLWLTLPCWIHLQLCRGSVSCENETGDVQVMREGVNWGESALDECANSRRAHPYPSTRLFLAQGTTLEILHISHGRPFSQFDTQRILSKISVLNFSQYHILANTFKDPSSQYWDSRRPRSLSHFTSRSLSISGTSKWLAKCFPLLVHSTDS
jgi:hypothetical protein